MMQNDHSIFITALFDTLIYEGGEADLKGDPGKYTLLGISSAYHPDCDVWTYLAENKVLAKHELRTILEAIRSGQEPSENGLWERVKKFYYIRFWMPGRLNEIAGISAAIAAEVFDTAVLKGYGNKKRAGAGVFLQETINLLNRAKTLYPNITVDGAIGPVTIKGLKACLLYNDEKLVVELLNHLLAESLIELMREKEDFEQFPGWFGRTISKRNETVLRHLDTIDEATASARASLSV